MEKKTFMVTMPALCSPNRAKLMSKKLWNWLLAQIQPWHPGTLTQGKITFEKCQRKRAKIQTYTHTFKLIEWISLGAGSLKGLVLARHSEDQKSPVLPVLKSRGVGTSVTDGGGGQTGIFVSVIGYLHIKWTEKRKDPKPLQQVSLPSIGRSFPDKWKHRSLISTVEAYILVLILKSIFVYPLHQIWLPACVLVD